MIKVPLLRHQRYISPSPLTSRVKTNDKMYQGKKMSTLTPLMDMLWSINFDTFDGHVMVNYIEPNLQEIIFGPIRVGLITQKQFWGHLKNCHSWGRTPNISGFKINITQQHPACQTLCIIRRRTISEY